jgi:hypothetical protein
MEQCYQLLKVEEDKFLVVDYDVKQKLVILWHLCSWFLFLACYEKGKDSFLTMFAELWDIIFERIFCGVATST